MRKPIILVSMLAIVGCGITGCYAPASTYSPQADRNFTLGTVQKSIYKGMSQSEVIEALGSPNMVTRDKDGAETWVYDKASTEAISTSNSVTGTVLLLTGNTSQASSKTSQRTLTLILKFKNSMLTHFTYNSTSF